MRPGELCGTYYTRIYPVESVRLVRHLGFRGLFTWVFRGAQRKTVVRHCAPCAPPCAPPAFGATIPEKPPGAGLCASLGHLAHSKIVLCAPAKRWTSSAWVKVAHKAHSLGG
jgi:hypothetical protein